MTHSYKIHFFHLIWSTKNREPWIDLEIQSGLYPYMGGIVRNLNGSLMEIGGMPDHLHLLVYMTNLDKYSHFIRDVKVHSTQWIHKNFPTHQNFAWQEGFASLTVSYSSLNKVRQYIQTQETHHSTMTFEEEFLKFLDKQKIQYDKRFVFG
jgi:putative transposase